MLRLTRWLAVLLSSVAVLWAAAQTRWAEELGQDQAQAAVPGTPASAARTASAEPDPSVWPPLFGEAAPTTAAEPPPPPALDYALKGLAAVGPNRWAVLKLGDVDHVVREGDALAPGTRIARIHAGGVDVLRDGQTVTLAFQPAGPGPESPNLAGADRAVSIAVVSGFPQAAGYRGITDEEIRDILAAAEARRVALPQ